MEINSFFKQRIDNAQKERALFTEYIELITPDQREIHCLDWETRQNNEQIELLRTEIVKFKSETDTVEENIIQKEKELEILKDEQYRKLSEIETFDEKLEQRQIEGMISYIYEAKNPPSLKNTDVKRDASPRALKHLSYKRVRSGEIVSLETKLAHIIQEDEILYESILVSMSETLEENKKHFDTQDKASNGNNNHHSNEISALYPDMDEEISKIENSELQSFSTVLELFRLRCKIMAIQRDEAEERQRLLRDQHYFTEKAKDTKAALTTDIKRLKSQSKKALCKTKADYEKQLVALQKRKAKIHEAIDKEQDLLKTGDSEIVKLQSMVDSSKARYERLRRHHALEMEGYGADAQLLRNRLRQVEKTLQQTGQAQGGAAPGRTSLSLHSPSSSTTRPMSSSKRSKEMSLEY